MSFKIPDTPEELFRQGSQKFSNFNKWIPYVLLFFVALYFVLTSFYTIDQDEVGVIRRFGKYLKTTEPGLHWKLPFGIDRVDPVKVKRVFKEEFGFRTVSAGVRTTYSNKSYDQESLMLTGDLNVLDISWIVQFKIKDPVQLLFNIRSPKETVRDLSEAVMRQVIGDYSVTDALTRKKNEINQEVKLKLQQILDYYESGIQVTELELQEVLPPGPVARSFNDVNEAEQEREKVIFQALEEYERVIPAERGKAEQTIREAEGYAVRRLKRAQGDASKFTQTWEAYKHAKDVTRKRMYLEALEEVLPKSGRKFIFEQDSNNLIPLLKLNEEMAK